MRKSFWILKFMVLMAAGAARAQNAYSLPELESLLTTSPATRISTAEQQIAEAKHSLALSDSSPRLFVSGTAASSVDPIRSERYTVEERQGGNLLSNTESVLTPQQDRYERLGAVIGIRIPLFGSRDLLARNVAVAEAGIGKAKIQGQVVRMEMLKALRYAYVEHYFRQSQRILAQAYVKAENPTLKILESRRRSRLLLNADYKAMRGRFLTAHYDISTANAGLEASAAVIHALTGQDLNDLEVVAPTLPTGCKVEIREGTQSNLHPALQLQAVNLEEKRRALAMTNSQLPDSALTVSQGLHRYGGGRSGNSTAVSIDLQFPIGGPDRESAARKLAIAEVSKAESEYDAQKEKFLQATGQISRELTVREANVALLEERLETSREIERVTRLRTAQSEGDVVERLVRSRHSLYQAYHAWLEGQMLLAKARVDMAGVGKCSPVRETYPVQLPEAVTLLSDALFPVSAVMLRNTVHQELQNGTATETSRKVLTLGWYAWHAFSRFEPTAADQFWARLPRTDRVMLSLTAAQISAVTSSAVERARLMELLSSAKQRRISVSLLLGDPRWVLPAESEKMLEIVRALKPFPFSGIHLDIEASQLPEAEQKGWASGLTALVRQLRSQSTLPIALSLHPRDTAASGHLADLKNAGVEEITVMQYTTNQQKAIENISGLMRRHPDLRFSLAQSIEPILPGDESYAKKDSKVANAAWENIALRLSSEPNFAGIIIQSLDDYLNGALNEN